MTKNQKVILYSFLGLAAVVILYFVLIHNGGVFSGKNEVTKVQGTENFKAPENMESEENTGSAYGTNSTDEVKTYSASNTLVTEDGVYGNGDHGYNFVIKPNGLTSGIDATRIYGITVDGIYYIQKEAVDRFNPSRKNPAPIGIGGPFLIVINKITNTEEWGFSDAGITKVNGVEFYTYKSPKGAVAEPKGHYRFCCWYMGTNKFFPHEGVKKGFFKPADGIVR